MRVMHIFSQSLLKDWSQWELRVIILLSLFLQVILTIFGSRRKYMVNRYLQGIVWLAYMSVDTVASVSLGILTRGHNVLQQLWFPFLLLHLGGPDTITAYALQDNELWLRHLITLIGQVMVAFYIFLTSQTPSAFISLAIPIFVAGIVKYGERTWVLWSASPDHFREFMRQRNREPHMPEIQVDKAYRLFKMARYLFADLLLKFDDVKVGKEILFGIPATTTTMIMATTTTTDLDTTLEVAKARGTAAATGTGTGTSAFELVEKELGYMYDVMYTKASIIYSKPGFFLRLISLLCSICSLTAFPFIIGKYDYSKIDKVITYILLVGAILLEIYALWLVYRSDWVRVRDATRHKSWSRSMAQHNLLEFCLEKGTKRYIKKLIATSKYEEQEVEDRLKNVIFRKIKEKDAQCNVSGFNQRSQKTLLAERGDQVLEVHGEQVLKYTIDVDFDQSLLIWHIATCICHRKEVEINRDNNQDISSNHDNDQDISSSLILSKYMLYLLVECPQMLPKVNGPSLYLDTREHAKKFFKENQTLAIDFKSRESLDLQKFIDGIEATTKMDESQLNLGFKLAQELQNRRPSNRWTLIREMWVEMLIYAATHGDWRYHAQRLTKGGELLTHVALLSAHVGFSPQCKLDDATSTHQTFLFLGW